MICKDTYDDDEEWALWLCVWSGGVESAHSAVINASAVDDRENTSVG